MSRSTHLNRYLICLVVGAAAGATPPTQAADTDLVKAQADMAQSYTDYYKALSTGPTRSHEQLRVLGDEMLATSHTQMNSLLDQRRTDFERSIYGKEYGPDGSVKDASVRSPASDPEPAAAPLQSTKKSDDAPAVSFTPTSQYSSGSRLPQVNTGAGSKRPDWVLDGKDIPAEMDFPGKPAAAKPPR